METKTRRNVYISDEAWDSLGKLAKDLCTSRSAVIELIALKLEEAETAPLGKFIQGILVEVLDLFKSGVKSNLEKAGLEE